VSLGNSIDVFSFWMILMLATGMAVVSKKSWVTSLFAVLAPWALIVVLKVGWTAIFG
jgi:chromate transport protein ChrA